MVKINIKLSIDEKDLKDTQKVKSIASTLFISGKSTVAIAKLLNKDYKTIKLWRIKYDQNTDLNKRRKGGGRKKKINTNKEDKIKKLLQEDPGIYFKDIAAKIRVSPQTKKKWQK